MDPVARVAMSLRASLYGLLASTRFRLTMNLATNQRTKRCDRTNVYMSHLDHLLQLPWADRQRVPPTEAARPNLMPRMTQIETGGKISRGPAGGFSGASSVESTAPVWR